MRAHRTFARGSSLGTVITSAVATLITLGILTGTTMLFQSRGKPMAELAAAERACAGRANVSDRERCIREWVAAAHGDRLTERQQAHQLPMFEAPMQSNTLRFVPELSCTTYLAWPPPVIHCSVGLTGGKGRCHEQRRGSGKLSLWALRTAARATAPTRRGPGRGCGPASVRPAGGAGRARG